MVGGRESCNLCRKENKSLPPFAPLLPLFQPRADRTPALIFPPAVLARVWREARTGEEAFLRLLDGAGVGEVARTEFLTCRLHNISIDADP